MKKSDFSHIFGYQIFIIVIMISSCLILLNSNPIITNPDTGKTANSENSIHNFNKTQLNTNTKITSIKTLNNSLNFFFMDNGGYVVTDIAIGKSNNVYVTGYTFDDNLITKNAFNTTFSGATDVFVARFNPEGQLIFSTYLGGRGKDQSSAIAVDSSGNCYITGITYSSDFPTKNAFQSTINSFNSQNPDVFVAKFNSTGGLAFSTFLGGSATDQGNSIAVDSAGNSYVTGTTNSYNFPTKNGLKNNFFGANNAFVSKFNTTGGLVFSTLLGGSGDDSGTAIAADSTGNSYVIGLTSSSNFPTKNAFNSSYNRLGETFVSKFNATGSLVFSTYLGGSNGANGNAIAVDGNDNCFVTGSTGSSDFPTLKAFNNTFGGIEDGFISEFNKNGGLIYSTYLGGSGDDVAKGIVIGSTGNYYIIGLTSSSDFPIQNNVYPTTSFHSGVFITKFNATNKLLESSIVSNIKIPFSFNSNILASDSNDNIYIVATTYVKSNTIILKLDTFEKAVSQISLSGKYYINGNAIATDKNGNRYITGDIETFSTHSPLNNTTIFNKTYENSLDVFVLKLNSVGSLSFITYLGGSNYDSSSSIAVDSAGNVYVTGFTYSSNFPTKNAYNSTYSGFGEDTFVTKLNATGSLVFSTYLGGSGSDEGKGIAVDSQGNSYVTGYTYSRNFPTLHAFDNTFSGDQDGFITKFNATGGLVFSTFLGGSATDQGNSIAVDSQGNSYVTGYTTSSDFPTLNAFNNTSRGGTDVFVAKFNAIGGLIFSTYLGGSGTEIGVDIAVDLSGNCFVVGFTGSTNFPIKNAFQTTNNGNGDIFVAKFNTNGSLLYSSYLGGNGADLATGIAVDSSDDAYITGFTSSANFPARKDFTNSLNGTKDAFVTKINSGGNLVFSTLLSNVESTLPLAIAVDNSGNSFVLGSTTSKNFTISNSNYAIPTGGTNVFLTEVNNHGSVIYSAYPGDSFILGIHENLASQPVSSQSIFQFLPFVIGSGLVIVVAFIGLYTAVEYRKYAKTKKDSHISSMISFKTYLKNKFTRSRNNSQTKPTLSDEVFEKLEEIEKENAPKE